MPRFVVLEHRYRGVHWDLMLECGEKLRTWALRQPPVGGEIAADPLADHRLVYLDYEGPISGNRGEVTRWDSGTYVLLQETSDRVTVQLEGHRLRGQATLTRAASGEGWTFNLATVENAE